MCTARFHDPNPERQAKRVLLNKWNGRPMPANTGRDCRRRLPSGVHGTCPVRQKERDEGAVPAAWQRRGVLAADAVMFAGTQVAKLVTI